MPYKWLMLPSNTHFMMAVQITRIAVLVLISFNFCNGLQVKPMHMNKNNKDCIEQGKKPFFDVELIIGQPWRIYYTWNVAMQDKCLDMVVKNATSSTINRIFNDMHEYLQVQPVWDAATLYASMGTAKHELLLFADQGPEGSLLGVPNVVKTGNMTPTRNAVPLLKFFMKLVNNGNYLLMMDCQIGVASLMSRVRPPYRAELHGVAKSLNLGEGVDACVYDKRKDEQSSLK